MKKPNKLSNNSNTNPIQTSETKRPKFVLHLSLFVGMLTLAIAGCTTTPKGYVAREWSQSLRELNIVPVFPPREDVYVGDIYLDPAPPDKEVKTGPLPIGQIVGRLTLTNELNAFYSTRASFPPTQPETTNFMANYTNNPFALLPQAADTNRDIFAGGDIHRLRMVGFPSFMSATFSQGDLSAVIPVEGINIGLAGSSSRSRTATISIPVAESYGLPSSEVLDAAVKGGKLSGAGKSFSGTNIFYCTGTKSINSNHVYLRLITEVFYTRAIDVSIGQKTTSGIGVSAKPMVSAGTVTQVVSTLSSNTNGSTSTTRTETGSTVERAAELNRQLTESLGQTTPGGSVKFVSAGDYGVGMRRTYERPIAIGYRALLLKIDQDGSVQNLGAVQSAAPTARLNDR